MTDEQKAKVDILVAVLGKTESSTFRATWAIEAEAERLYSWAMKND